MGKESERSPQVFACLVMGMPVDQADGFEGFPVKKIDNRALHVVRDQGRRIYEFSL